jgi:hypothetical protein
MVTGVEVGGADGGVDEGTGACCTRQNKAKRVH